MEFGATLVHTAPVHPSARLKGPVQMVQAPAVPKTKPGRAQLGTNRLRLQEPAVVKTSTAPLTAAPNVPARLTSRLPRPVIPNAGPKVKAGAVSLVSSPGKRNLALHAIPLPVNRQLRF